MEENHLDALDGWYVFMLPPLYTDIDQFYADVENNLHLLNEEECTVLIDSVWVDGDDAIDRFCVMPYRDGHLVLGEGRRLEIDTPEMEAAIQMEQEYFERE